MLEEPDAAIELQIPDRTRVSGRLDGTVPRFASWGGGFVGGGTATVVFRRADVPAWQPTGARIEYEKAG